MKDLYKDRNGEYRVKVGCKIVDAKGRLIPAGEKVKVEHREKVADNGAE